MWENLNTLPSQELKNINTKQDAYKQKEQKDISEKITEKNLSTSMKELRQSLHELKKAFAEFQKSL